MKKINWEEISKHLYKPLVVQFWDHAMGNDPVLCCVIGYLAENTPLHMKIVAWDCPELEGNDRLYNMEYFSILKSTIVKIKPLRTSKKWG